MRTVWLILKAALIIAVIVVGLFASVIGVFAWSNSNVAEAHGRCEMRTVEQKIEDAKHGEYLRNCMKAQGYPMLFNCYVEGNTVASCFLPRWIFWVNKADF